MVSYYCECHLEVGADTWFLVTFGASYRYFSPLEISASAVWYIFVLAQYTSSGYLYGMGREYNLTADFINMDLSGNLLGWSQPWKITMVL